MDAPTREALKKFFKEHDKNGDGRLDKEELKQAFRHLGTVIPGWRALRAMNYADADRDGFITEPEMTDLVNYAAQFGFTALDKTLILGNKDAPAAPLSTEQLKKIFKEPEKRGDGRLDKEELKKAFQRLDALTPGWRASLQKEKI